MKRELSVKIYETFMCSFTCIYVAPQAEELRATARWGLLLHEDLPHAAVALPDDVDAFLQTLQRLALR